MDENNIEVPIDQIQSTEEKKRVEKYYRTESLTSKDVYDPTDLICEEIDRRNGNCFLVLGENDHHGAGTLDYENQLIDDLIERGYEIKKVFMEEEEWYNQHLETYYQTGDMHELLEFYLKEGFVRRDVKKGHDYKLKFIRKCKEEGVPVMFIDENSNQGRDADWFEKIKGELGENVDGLYILIAGKNHATRSEVSGPGGTSTTVVQHLDRKYPEAVCSALCSNIDTEDMTQNASWLENRFAFDLKEVGRWDRPTGIRIANSPYVGKRWNPSKSVGIEEEFDLFLALPGRLLAKIRA